MKRVLALLLLALFVSPSLWAHKVNVFAYVEDGKVYTESYFNDGSPCKNAKIEVYDKADAKLLEGTTDEKGFFVFPVPKRDDLRIVLIASMGHRAETTLTADEIGELTEAQGEPSLQTMGISPDELKKVVGEAVREGINPLVRTLQEERSRVRFGEVIGGIGYILGIWGTISFILSRRKR
jgi:nickel transport protein